MFASFFWYDRISRTPGSVDSVSSTSQPTSFLYICTQSANVRAEANDEAMRPNSLR